jgi:hypothetical protein
MVAEEVGPEGDLPGVFPVVPVPAVAPAKALTGWAAGRKGLELVGFAWVEAQSSYLIQTASVEVRHGLKGHVLRVSDVGSRGH